VYTAIFGAIPDLLRASGRPRPDPTVRWVCFTDDPARVAEADRWDIRPPRWNDPDPRRAARHHKTLSHVLFPDADYVVWHDGNIRLRVDPWRLVERHLAENDVAAFKHRDRTCVYEELEACIRLDKDEAGLMRRQVEVYRNEGYPALSGLAETGVLARRQSERVRAFNEAWWREIESGSVRDQLSFNVVLWRMGMRHALFPGQSRKSPYVHYVRHR
jgi:hypothetical protein